MLNALFSFCAIVVCAQSTKGITGVRDTSFTIHSEYTKQKKKYPFIKIVQPLQQASVKEKRGLIYCNQGSRKLKLDAFYPAKTTTQKRAAIIILHGGGWRSGDRTQHHPLAQRLASLGYVTFTPEYRLSTEALYPAALHDVKAAVRWVRSQATAYSLDTSKIAVAGFSAGGMLASLLGTTNGQKDFETFLCNTNVSSNANAIINLDGTLSFVHPESGEGDDSKKTSAATYWFGFSKREEERLWQQASPLSHVGPQTPPTLFINSSVARMHAGRNDFVQVLNGHRIYNEVHTFAGAPHSYPLFHPWFDSTVTYINNFLQAVFFPIKKRNVLITVAKDGTGDFTKVQDAFNAIPQHNKQPYHVFIRNGVYKEKLYLDSTKQNITITGEDKFKTVLTYEDHSGKIAPNGDTINTFTSYTFLQEGANVKIANLTIENNAGYSAGQAVAMHVMGDRVKFENCRFLGNQDVLYAGKPATRQYFENCYIEGTTDFIFGPSTAWFEKCHVNSKRNSHITAASTPKEEAFGYVFNNCVLTTDSLNVNKVTLGRPWRPYASVAYINCYMGAHIIPEGWNNWRNEANEATARYAEYNAFGPGARPADRAKWSRQLTEAEAKAYNLTNVFRDWNPLID